MRTHQAYMVVLALAILVGGAAVHVVRLLLPVNPHRGARGVSRHQYYAILLQGKKVGYGEWVRHATGDSITTREYAELTVSRNGSIAHVSVVQTSIETVDGKPLRGSGCERIGETTRITEAVLGAGGDWEVTGVVGGITHSVRVRHSPDSLMTEGLRLVKARHGLENGTVIRARTITPLTLKPAETVIDIGPQVSVDVMGRTVSAVQIRTTTTSEEGVISGTSYVDNGWQMIKGITVIAGLELEWIACTKEYALMSGDAQDVAEMISVPCPRPLGDVRRFQAITYELLPQGEAVLRVPNSDYQTVTVKEGGNVVVTVRPVCLAGGGRFPYQGGDHEAIEALLPSQFIQSDHEEMIKAARSIIGSTTDATDAVRSIRRSVHDRVKGSDALNYATALDVLRSGQGDCSEQAVLMVALCRAVGIPAQVVTGMVYMEECTSGKAVFVPHAWARVLVEGTWVWEDPTCWPDKCGAGYIALAYSNGNPEGLGSCVSSFKIVDVSTDPAMPRRSASLPVLDVPGQVESGQ